MICCQLNARTLISVFVLACIASLFASGAAGQPDIVVSVRTDSATYTLGQAVRLTITGTSTLNRTLVVDYTSSCVYDFQIADSLGREVFTYTKNAHCLHDGMLGGATFVPGQTVAFNPAWNQTDDSGKLVAPGEYQVNASLVGVESQNAVMFTVNAPAPGQIPSSPPSQYPMILIAVAGIAAAVCAVALLAMRRRRHAPTLEGEAVVAAHGSAKFCVSCRAELPTDAKFCDNCGASQT